MANELGKVKVTIVLLCTLQLTGTAENWLIGTPAPEWSNDQWINSPSLKLVELKRKVVLIRFFMESDCPFCRASAPHLNRFYDAYASRGLVVIGMYTPKPAPVSTPMETVRRYVTEYGFRFPVALDNDWTTLNKYWLHRVADADFTSVTFLIDKKGIVRYIHPGGAYSPDDAAQIQKKIEELLLES